MNEACCRVLFAVLISAAARVRLSAEDCNGNYIDDADDIRSGYSKDCNRNGSPDECDIAAGNLDDSDGDGIADACLRRLSFRVHPTEPMAETFHRGDPNSDGKADLSDAVVILRYLFDGTAPPKCMESGDFNNDGLLNITDPIAELSFLFLGGAGPAAPGLPPAPCGPDPAEFPGHLGCKTYFRC